MRRDQILDAVVATILARGVDGTTVSEVADRLGMRPSHIRHYLGSRDEMLRAAVERAVEAVERAVEEHAADVPPERRPAVQLDAVFGRAIDRPEVNQLVDELIAASYRDEHLRSLVAGMYTRFGAAMRASIAAAYPEAPAALRRRVAHGLLALAHARATFQVLGFERANAAHLRSAADALLAQLTGGPGPAGVRA